jgi:hypothetical protein
MRFECGFERFGLSADQKKEKKECLPDFVRASLVPRNKPEVSETTGGAKFGHTSGIAAAR